MALEFTRGENMMFNLENDFLKVGICEDGAEVHSVVGKKEGVQFLWNGDQEYWKYHAPVLFPIVGKVLDNKYMVDGKVYSLPQHGFARVSKFIKWSDSESSITFKLDYNENTLKVYPFKFSFEIKYTLDKGLLITEYRIMNKDNKKILFSVGAHPAFMCPLLPDETLNDYYFEFNEKETTPVMEISQEGYFTHINSPYLNNESVIPLSKQVFKNEALVFYDLKSHIIALKSKKHNKFVEFDFTDFPYLGLWSKPTGAPFVCIEPWFGHGDFEDFLGEFKDKAGIISLEENKEFVCSYSMKIHQ